MGVVSLSVTKRLFALSRNRCAFEGCKTQLVDDDGVVIGRICHIKGARKGAPRHDENQSDKERHGFDNLLLLCGPHHDVIDKAASEWTVESLAALKAAHEAGGEAPQPAEDRVCKQLVESTTIYEQGLRVGNIHAESVQVAGRDIHNHPGAPADESDRRERREAARAANESLIQLHSACLAATQNDEDAETLKEGWKAWTAFTEAIHRTSPFLDASTGEVLKNAKEISWKTLHFVEMVQDPTPGSTARDMREVRMRAFGASEALFHVLSVDFLGEYRSILKS